MPSPRRNPWREEVLKELCNHRRYDEAKHAANPQKALADLLEFEIELALDPAVSFDARQLIAAFSSELNRWKTGDWCDTCHAPQMVAADGTHACVSLPTLHKMYSDQLQINKETEKQLRRAAARISELESRIAGEQSQGD